MNHAPGVTTWMADVMPAERRRNPRCPTPFLRLSGDLTD
jgi:hypothetical protein